MSNNQTTSVNPAIEPMIIADEQELSTKNKRRLLSSLSANKIFAFSLFILLIILISYILFHGQVTDIKLTRLANNVNSDNRQLLEEINRTLKSIELLITQMKGPMTSIEKRLSSVQE
jgi:hypothetical protein